MAEQHQQKEGSIANGGRGNGNGGAAAGTGTGDVLVVEDDPEINELIGAYVELAGLSCRRVMRGEEALREARERRPSLIVLDVMLPDMDGFEVCRRLRAEAGTSDVPIVMLTALDQAEMRKRACQCGANEYLTKPFDPDQLLETIRQRARQNGEAVHAEGGV
jgi:DNA-binding response OmpR family regulator